MNVLGVCNTNMEFIYYLDGWEGSAHDGRVLRDALVRPNGLKVPRGSGPRTPEEMFNMRHATARNSIERAFAKIVNACCLLHNYIRGEVGADVWQRMYMDEDDSEEPALVDDDDLIMHIQPTAKWTQFRNNLAQDMWANRGWAGQ
ncbi:unnamed protein product [Linum tenue]|uniref:Transposase n=1 Tax=Linum tenue TaxID=586396 RepID=A0AAV0PX80_9ROSI|nr:unnamed protein product [Linum tenue]